MSLGPAVTGMRPSRGRIIGGGQHVKRVERQEESVRARVQAARRSVELCEHPERGCPLAAPSPELARADNRMKPQIAAELVNYKNQMLPFMPGQQTTDKERAFFAIFSTMIGAVEIARLLPDRAMREKVLANTKSFLLGSF